MGFLQDIKNERKNIEEIINHRAKAKTLSISDLVEDYKLGRSKEFLKTKYKLRDNELNYVLNQNLTATDRNKRNENINKVTKIDNMMGLSKMQRDEKQKDESKTQPPENLKESIEAVLNAIKDVEGEER